MFLTILYVIGISAEAMSATLIAGRHKMDLIGVLFIALAAAIGGGSVRDVLFGHYPLTWVAHPQYIIVVCVAALLTTLIPRVIARLERLFLALDALGLVVFAVIGAEVVRVELANMSEEAQTYGVVLVVCGAVITGVFGGVLRDIFCGVVPLVFRQELYAFVAIITGVLYYLLILWGFSVHNASIISLISGFSLRMLAIHYKLGVPIFSYEDEPKVPKPKRSEK